MNIVDRYKQIKERIKLIESIRPDLKEQYERFKTLKEEVEVNNGKF
jgi:hypothetical protein